MPYRVNPRRIDANQVALVEAARGVGATVLVTSSLGRGQPDLVVLWRGKGWLVEVKSKGGVLTPAEKRYEILCREPVYRVETVEELLSIIGAIA